MLMTSKPIDAQATPAEMDPTILSSFTHPPSVFLPNPVMGYGGFLNKN